ncbi:hypothetical protein [Streptomyces sp. NPDC005525]|uniref:hypothetical protein n=1 Tax=Streptomyces sp. NPDC005525 TaxID=3364720 RepID=UPI0036AA3A30
MLRPVRLMVSAAAAAAVVGLIATPAGADGPGTSCPPGVLDCDVISGGGKPPAPGTGGGDDGGSGGGGGGGSAGSVTCTAAGKKVPCFREDLGWFNASDNCYWEVADPQPTAADKDYVTATTGAPDDWKPGNGRFYNVTCPDAPIAGGLMWRQTPPPGLGGGPDLAALAQEAVTKMRLLGADVGIAPKAGGKGGSVGLPVWVWNQEGPRTTGPAAASATALGVTVTATATVKNVAWDFGNGTTVSCPFPGKPYVSSYGAQVPDKGRGQCGFAGYHQSGNYTVNATTTWAVHWAGGGQQGDLTTTRASEVQIRIGEVQVVGQ